MLVYTVHCTRRTQGACSSWVVWCYRLLLWCYILLLCCYRVLLWCYRLLLWCYRLLLCCYRLHVGTVEPLTNDHPHQRPSLSYDHISCDGQGILFVYESLTSDHPSYTTTPMWFWGWSYKRGSTVYEEDMGSLQQLGRVMLHVVTVVLHIVTVMLQTTCWCMRRTQAACSSCSSCSSRELTARATRASWLWGVATRSGGRSLWATSRKSDSIWRR